MEEELGWVAREVRPYGRTVDDYRNLIHVLLAPMDRRADALALREGREVRFFGPGELPAKLTPHAQEILSHFFSARGARRE